MTELKFICLAVVSVSNKINETSVRQEKNKWDVKFQFGEKYKKQGRILKQCM